MCSYVRLRRLITNKKHVIVRSVSINCREQMVRFPPNRLPSILSAYHPLLLHFIFYINHLLDDKQRKLLK